MDSGPRIYRSLQSRAPEEIKNILKNGTRDQLLLLPLEVGLNLADRKAAQDVCVSLLKHDDAEIRANAVVGLAHIARTKNQLDKRIVKPYILRELRENHENRENICDAIERINRFLGWHLAKKALTEIKKSPSET